MNEAGGAAVISVVMPVHNEAQGITHAVSEVHAQLQGTGAGYEIVLVDDGSSDGSFDRIRELSAADPRVKGIRFSRNFGKESALLAGLRAARGQAVITLDADLQHPPALIPRMLERWRGGAKVVHAVKQDRSKDSHGARWRAALFNNLLRVLGGVDVRNSSDFKLLDREVVQVVTRDLPERSRFYRGLVEWAGYERAEIPFTVAARHAGEGKWSPLKLVELAGVAILSFTSAPLRIVTLLGLVTLLFAFAVAAETLWSWFHGNAVSGFATIIITLLLLGSFIMISLGIMGEYIAKIYDEIKARPSYLVDARCGFDGETVGAGRHHEG